MKIYTEQSLSKFNFWSGARDTADKLTEDEFEIIENTLEELYPEGMSETKVNDFFWFEDDYIAKMLGYDNWEELEADREYY